MLHYSIYPFKKKKLQILFTALFIFLLTTIFLYSYKNPVVQADTNVLILWEQNATQETIVKKLAPFSESLVILEHMENFTICQPTIGTNVSSMLSKLSRLDGVLVAEPDQTVQLSSLPNDTFFDTQWAHHNTGIYSYYIDSLPILRNANTDIDLNIPEAWDIFPEKAKTKSVVVAIIDTGVDIRHVDLQEHIWNNPAEIPDNGIDDDHNGYTDDVHGWDFYHNDNTICHYFENADGSYVALDDDNDNHGTLCAGIIAASSNNETGIAGIASNIDIKILPIKIHGGLKGAGSVSNAIKAVKYATSMGADICNMSWGTSTYSEALELVMRESDMLFVCAAGNNGQNNNSTPMYPACYELDNVISVAYVNAYGNLAFDSNYGTSTVDIVAPGTDIYSTIVGDNYAYASGTSMATPHVSGIAALLYACGEQLYASNAKEIIVNNLKPMDHLIGYIKYAGIPNAVKIVQSADNLVSDTIAPVLQIESEYAETNMRLHITAEDLGGSGIRVIKYAPGERTLDYFSHGTLATSITTSTIEVAKTGIYTFYISDYAGNESIQTYYVKEDTTPPSVSASYQFLHEENAFLVTIQVSDTESGLKMLRYLPGRHSTDSFLSAGIDLKWEGNIATFLVKTPTLYSIYATDYRGNKTQLELNVKFQPATQIVLNIKKRML